MKSARTILLLLHIGGLTMGAFIVYLAALSVIDNFASDSVGVAAHRIANAAALFLVTAAFGNVLVSRGFTLFAPPLFAMSFIAVGVVVHVNTLVMSKSFAPFEATPLSYAVSIAKIVAVCVLALIAVIWTRRRSRYPLA